MAGLDWWAGLENTGPHASWKGPVGVKEDGGGSIRGCGRIGSMRLHRAVCNRNAERESQPPNSGRAGTVWVWAGS